MGFFNRDIFRIIFYITTIPLGIFLLACVYLFFDLENLLRKKKEAETGEETTESVKEENLLSSASWSYETQAASRFDKLKLIILGVLISSFFLGIPLLSITGEIKDTIQAQDYMTASTIIVTIIAAYVLLFAIISAIQSWFGYRYMFVPIKEKAVLLSKSHPNGSNENDKADDNKNDGNSQTSNNSPETQKCKPDSKLIPGYFQLFLINFSNYIKIFTTLSLFIGITALLGWFFGVYLGKPRLMIVFLYLSLLLAYIFSPLYFQLTGKSREIKEGEIFDVYTEMLNKAGVSPRKLMILTLDNNRANALITGLLPNFGGVFLTETLVKNLDTEEIKAIIAHELGHIKKNHLWTRTGIFTLWSLILFLTYTSPIIRTVSSIGVFLFIMFFSYISRKQESEADIFAAEMTSPDDIISALKHLENINYGTVGKMFKQKNDFEEQRTHPGLEKRIEVIEKHFE